MTLFYLLLIVGLASYGAIGNLMLLGLRHHYPREYQRFVGDGPGGVLLCGALWWWTVAAVMTLAWRAGTHVDLNDGQ